jgi:CheY-like chemotaxis protein
MLRPSLPPNIDIELQLEQELPEIHADPGQVERVLINLATNARDAMPEGGKIIFSTSKVRSREALLPSEDGTEFYLCLRVTDNGCGMDEETRQRIFEPFFTTKARGKGTGLGMPVVYGLMQSHNGFVDVRSQLGKGTSISLYFPVPTRPLAPPVAENHAAPQKLEGTETILVVDDEPDVLIFLKVILEQHGYHIHGAHNAHKALEILAQKPDEIQLLISDVGLPQTNGFELNRMGREIQPRLRTILTSGYTDGSFKTRMAEERIEGFMLKPYDMKALLEMIRSVLDQSALR